MTTTLPGEIATQDVHEEAGRLDRICRVTERLIEVIERETSLLRAVRSGETADVRQLKLELTEAYQSESRTIRDISRTELLADAGMPELIRLSGALADATAENEAALRSSMTLNASVMQIIARSATRSATEGVAQTYGAGLQTRYGRARPVAVNTAG